MVEHIAIVGSSGALGEAFVEQFSKRYPNTYIHSFSRHPSHQTLEHVMHYLVDYENKDALETAVTSAGKQIAFDRVIVTIGMLHNHEIIPEKSLRDLSTEKFQHLFYVNTILPALAAKVFLPRLNRQRRSVFAALSARVGSISDNYLGGWYAYRASKAALNMVIKTASVEIKRSNKHAIVVGLHPGTVDSPLSQPFQKNVPEGKLFTPKYAVENMLTVLDKLEHQHSGKCFAWDGQEIVP